MVHQYINKTFLKNPVSTFAQLPPGSFVGETRLVINQNALYQWNGSQWINAGIAGTGTFRADGLVPAKDDWNIAGYKLLNLGQLTSADDKGFDLLSDALDGADSKIFSIDTINSIVNTGARLLSLSVQGVEKFAIDKDGDIVVGGGLTSTGNVDIFLDVDNDDPDEAFTIYHNTSLPTAGLRLFQVRADGEIELFGGPIYGGASSFKFISKETDGASTIAFELDTDNAFNTSGAKLFVILNNTVEKFAINKDGDITTGGTVDGRDVSTDGSNLDTHLGGGNNLHDASEVDVEGLYTYLSTDDLETVIGDIDGELDTLHDLIVWNRVGTILSPKNAGDDVDMGTGDLKATEIESVTSPVYNVKAWGLKGDWTGAPGHTDNSPLLATLIAAIVASGTGGTIYFPVGDYGFDSVVDFTSITLGIKIIGENGWGGLPWMIFENTSINGFMNLTTGSLIQDIAIFGYHVDANFSAFHTKTNNHAIRFHHCVANGGKYGISCSPGCHYIHIDETDLSNAIATSGIIIDNCSDITISNSYINNMTANAITVNSSNNIYIQNIKLDTIGVKGIDAHDVSSLQILNINCNNIVDDDIEVSGTSSCLLQGYSSSKVAYAGLDNLNTISILDQNNLCGFVRIARPVDGDAGIVTAINEVNTAGGGIVQLLAGTYIIDTGIVPNTGINNVILQGAGAATILEHDGILASPCLQLKGSSIQNTSINNTTSGNLVITYNILADAGNVQQGDRLWIQGTDAWAATDYQHSVAAANGNPVTGQVTLKSPLQRTLTSVSCRNIRGGDSLIIRDLKLTSLGPLATAFGIDLPYTGNCTIENVFVDNWDGGAARGAISIADYGINNIIENCRISDTVNGGIHMRKQLGSFVFDNILIDTNRTPGTDQGAITISSECVDCEISRNLIRTSGSIGIEEKGTASRRIVVSDNGIYNTTSHGLLIRYETIVENNIIENIPVTAVALQFGNRTIVRGNIIKNCVLGIETWDTADRLMISDNHIENMSTMGMSLLCDNSIITDNLIKNTGANHGILSKGEKNIISNNRLETIVGRGIMINTGGNNLVNGNFVTNSTSSGIQISTNNNIITCNHCDGLGISVTGSGNILGLNKE